MENLFILIIDVIISLLIALLGKKRTIGFGWSFALCLFFSPIIGLVVTLCFKKKDVEFFDVKKNDEIE